MTSKFKGAIFDMDGTILDSMGHWRGLNTEFLAKRGLEVPEEIRGKELTTSSSVTSRLYAERYDLGMTWQEIIQEFEDSMAPIYRDIVQPKPGAAQLLRSLKARGLRLCVATLTPQSAAEMALGRHGLLDLFEFVLCASDTGLKKSDPEFFRHVAARMGLLSEECLVFEDALYAMRGARAAGCGVVAVDEPASRPHLAQIRETCHVYVDNYEFFTLDAFKRIDKSPAAEV
jgi:HAD superfamily hydrolase (TIGR01509 family)